jgi:chromosome segregation ATPase
MNNGRSILARAILAFVVALLLHELGSAQVNGVVSPVDTFAVIVPARPAGEISADLDAIVALRTRARARLDNAKEQVRKTEADITTKKKEIDVLEAREDAADKGKNDTVVTAIKKQIKGVENLIDLLKRRLNTRSADVEAAEGLVDYADAATTMYKKELDLAKKNAERASELKSGTPKSTLVQLDQTIREQEIAFLEAQVDRLKKQENSLSLERDLVKEQMKLAEAQTEFTKQ